jgi:hypothetical protein
MKEFNQSTMLPTSLKDMKTYVEKKASKLSLYIYARNRIQVSAKKSKYFSHCLRKSMKGAVSVGEACALIKSEIQRLWTLSRFRTQKNFHICRLKIDDFWIRGVFPPKILHLKNDPAFKKEAMRDYFGTVATAEDEFIVGRYIDEYIPVYLDIIADDSSE